MVIFRCFGCNFDDHFLDDADGPDALGFGGKTMVLAFFLRTVTGAMTFFSGGLGGREDEDGLYLESWGLQ
jgi:hypothetical protein